MVFEEMVIAVVAFLTVPTWHLVVFFVIIFAIILYLLIASLGF